MEWALGGTEKEGLGENSQNTNDCRGKSAHMAVLGLANPCVLCSDDPSLMSPAISATGLTYCHHPASPPSLVDVNLTLPPGSRTILVGANGGLRTHSTFSGIT